MRHGYQKKTLGRPTAHREAMLRNMVTSLLKFEKITTTDAKAKELRKLAEKMITLGKRGELHARRQALAVIRERDVVEKVFSEYAERYRERKGGYTRIIKVGFRDGDNAPVSIIEFVRDQTEAKAKTEGKIKGEAKSKAKSVAKPKAKAEAKPKAKAKAEAKPKTKVKTAKEKT